MLGLVLGAFFAGDLAITMFLLSGSEYGQAGLAVLVALVGFVLNQKSKQIHVLVNQRMTDATEQIRAQNLRMVAQDERIAALERALQIQAGGEVPQP
jgi:hypothetical protein